MTTPQQPLPVDVAIAILLTPDGRFLLTMRPEGKPLAGSWELPGGKRAPGETIVAALRRELFEELGIDIGTEEEDSRPLPIVEHAYPHALVRLHPHVITRWHGEPRPREGQRFSWESIWHDETSVAPVLPATGPVIEALRSIRTVTRARPLGLAPSRHQRDD